MPLFRITHTTTHRHATPAAVAWQTLRLQPRREHGQECVSFELEVTPRPVDLAAHTDFFGNTTHVFSLRAPHAELRIHATSVVRRDEPSLPMAGLTPTAAGAIDLVDAAVLAGDFSLEQYRHASPLVPLLPDARALAGDFDPAVTPLLTWLSLIGERFGERFTFAPAATTVSTPLASVLRARRGVCQDFAHVFVSCLRQHGLPAAYVSGYLLTKPPPGKPRLRGADAMHAWVSVFVPGTGWVDYDPTNQMFAGAGHIVVARGRDYADVSPVRGVFNGGSVPLLTLGVTVEPEAEPAET